MSNNYITAPDIEQFYEANTPDLATVANRICTIIDDYCYTSFSTASKSNERLDSKREIRPTMGPILGVVSITDNKVTLSLDEDYYPYSDRIVIANPSFIRRGISVSYNYGYYPTPPIVREVALELARYYAELGNTELLFRKQQSDTDIYELSDRDDLYILSKLDGFKRPRPGQPGGGGDTIKGKKILRVGVI